MPTWHTPPLCSQGWLQSPQRLASTACVPPSVPCLYCRLCGVCTALYVCPACLCTVSVLPSVLPYYTSKSWDHFTCQANVFLFNWQVTLYLGERTKILSLITRLKSLFRRSHFAVQRGWGTHSHQAPPPGRWCGGPPPWCPAGGNRARWYAGSPALGPAPQPRAWGCSPGPRWWCLSPGGEGDTQSVRPGETLLSVPPEGNLFNPFFVNGK